MHYRFEWDRAKALANLRKHGVCFDETRSVFTDRWAIEAYDEKHSTYEHRLMITGMSDHNRVLVAAFILRDHETIRIISSRRANRNEEQAYEENLRID